MEQQGLIPLPDPSLTLAPAPAPGPAAQVAVLVDARSLVQSRIFKSYHST